MVQFVPQCPKVHPKISNCHLVAHGSHDNLEKKIMLKPSTFSWLKIVPVFDLGLFFDFPCQHSFLSMFSTKIF